MDLRVVHLDYRTKTYVMDGDYLRHVIGTQRGRKLTPEDLAENERENRETGLKAELRIMEYERHRLSGFPALASQVEHVAKSDVSLGYDIKSFEGGDKEPGSVRLIEVKAVSSRNFEFNWTSNEIETAKRTRSQYALYLLPVMARDRFDIAHLKTIRDPYESVLNSDEWTKHCEILSLKQVQSQSPATGPV